MSLLGRLGTITAKGYGLFTSVDGFQSRLWTSQEISEPLEVNWDGFAGKIANVGATTQLITPYSGTYNFNSVSYSWGPWHNPILVTSSAFSTGNNTPATTNPDNTIAGDRRNYFWASNGGNAAPLTGEKLVLINPCFDPIDIHSRRNPSPLPHGQDPEGLYPRLVAGAPTILPDHSGAVGAAFIYDTGTETWAELTNVWTPDMKAGPVEWPSPYQAVSPNAHEPFIINSQPNFWSQPWKIGSNGTPSASNTYYSWLGAFTSRFSPTPTSFPSPFGSGTYSGGIGVMNRFKPVQTNDSYIVVSGNIHQFNWFNDNARLGANENSMYTPTLFVYDWSGNVLGGTALNEQTYPTFGDAGFAHPNWGVAQPTAGQSLVRAFNGFPTPEETFNNHVALNPGPAPLNKYMYYWCNGQNGNTWGRIFVYDLTNSVPADTIGASPVYGAYSPQAGNVPFYQIQGWMDPPFAAPGIRYMTDLVFSPDGMRAWMSFQNASPSTGPTSPVPTSSGQIGAIVCWNAQPAGDWTNATVEYELYESVPSPITGSSTFAGSAIKATPSWLYVKPTPSSGTYFQKYSHDGTLVNDTSGSTYETILANWKYTTGIAIMNSVTPFAPGGWLDGNPENYNTHTKLAGLFFGEKYIYAMGAIGTLQQPIYSPSQTNKPGYWLVFDNDNYDLIGIWWVGRDTQGNDYKHYDSLNVGLNYESYLNPAAPQYEILKHYDLNAVVENNGGYRYTHELRHPDDPGYRLQFTSRVPTSKYWGTGRLSTQFTDAERSNIYFGTHPIIQSTCHRTYLYGLNSHTWGDGYNHDSFAMGVTLPPTHPFATQATSTPTSEFGQGKNANSAVAFNGTPTNPNYVKQNIKGFTFIYNLLDQTGNTYDGGPSVAPKAYSPSPIRMGTEGVGLGTYYTRITENPRLHSGGYDGLTPAAPGSQIRNSMFVDSSFWSPWTVAPSPFPMGDGFNYFAVWRNGENPNALNISSNGTGNSAPTISGDSSVDTNFCSPTLHSQVTYPSGSEVCDIVGPQKSNFFAVGVINDPAAPAGYIDFYRMFLLRQEPVTAGTTLIHPLYPAPTTYAVMRTLSSPSGTPGAEFGRSIAWDLNYGGAPAQPGITISPQQAMVVGAPGDLDGGRAYLYAVNKMEFETNVTASVPITTLYKPTPVSGYVPAGNVQLYTTIVNPSGVPTERFGDRVLMGSVKQNQYVPIIVSPSTTNQDRRYYPSPSIGWGTTMARIIVGIPNATVDGQANAGRIDAFTSDGTLVYSLTQPGGGQANAYFGDVMDSFVMQDWSGDARYGKTTPLNPTLSSWNGFVDPSNYMDSPHWTTTHYVNGVSGLLIVGVATAASNSGEVYVYDFYTGEYYETISNPNGTNNPDKFGTQVKFMQTPTGGNGSGGTASSGKSYNTIARHRFLVTAPEWDESPTITNVGKAYVFQKNGWFVSPTFGESYIGSASPVSQRNYHFYKPWSGQYTVESHWSFIGDEDQFITNSDGENVEGIGWPDQYDLDQIKKRPR